MVETPSTMVALGMRAPDFRLRDVTGEMIARDDFAGAPGLLVMFICNHCPYVKHIRHELARLGNDYPDTGIGIVAIMSNDVESTPADHPDRMAEEKEAFGYTFPYLYDETQEVAKAYSAVCTPDFFLFDSDFALVYRGQLDGSRPGSDVPATGRDLRAALDALIAGEAVDPDQRPSLGCNIKWKRGI